MYTKFNRLFVTLFLAVFYLAIQPGSQLPTQGEDEALDGKSEPKIDGSSDVNTNIIDKESKENHTGQLVPTAELKQLGDTFVIIKLITPSQIDDIKFKTTKFKIELDESGNSTWKIVNDVKVHVSKSWGTKAEDLILYNMELKFSGLMSGKHYRISSDIVYHNGTNRQLVKADPYDLEFRTKLLPPEVKLTPGPLIINFSANDAVKYFVEVKKENDPDCFINITVSAKFSKSLTIPGLADSETYLIKVWYQDGDGRESAPVSETHTIVLDRIVI